MQRVRVLIGTILLFALLAPAASSVEETKTPTGEAAPSSERVAAGDKVPAMKLKALLPDAKEPKDLDLSASLGKRPVVICYIRLGESLGEEGFLSMQSLAQGPLKGKIDFFGATNPGPKMTMPESAERLSLLGVALPFLLDEDFKLGRTLGVTSAPSFTLIDAGGALRVVDAKSLKQNVTPTVTMSEAIQGAAKGGFVPTVAKLPRYYPANELVGEQFPDFILKKFEGTDRVKMSEAVAQDRKDNKVPVLFFWHPNCPHCKKAMPGIMVGFNSYRKWLDLISIVDLKDADEIKNARDTIRAHSITFPVLQDEERRITDMYKVVSTPTFVFLKPDGVIDSVYTSGDVNFVTVFSAKIQSLLGVGVRRK